MTSRRGDLTIPSKLGGVPVTLKTLCYNRNRARAEEKQKEYGFESITDEVVSAATVSLPPLPDSIVLNSSAAL